MIISIDTKKLLKVSKLLFDKTLTKLGTERLSQHNKGYIWKTIPNIRVKSEKLIPFPLRSGTRQGYALS
jgi:hypothetical protein